MKKLTEIYDLSGNRLKTTDKLFRTGKFTDDGKLFIGENGGRELFIKIKN